MTAPNHILGGIAITGISLSFFDINIFSNSTYLSFCIFCSLLPDVDHPKSLIGKVFYPLAKYLDRNFGHRTITHSVSVWIPLFIFLLLIELNLINTYFERIGIDYSLIFLFSYLSHLILDMLTVQGIPLFFPFMKNPCVVPANPTMRLKSGNMKTEAMGILIFGLVIFSSYDLFKNGFWTTYNRSFGTIKHAFREFKESEKIIYANCTYSFNGATKEVKGYILDATENNVEIWVLNERKNRIFNLDKTDLRYKNINIKVSKSKHQYSVTDLDLFNLSLEEINDTLNNKIVSGKILASEKFIVNNHKALKGSIDLNKEIYPIFQWFKNDSIKRDLVNKLKLKNSKLQEIQNSNYKEIDKLKRLKIDLKNYEKSIVNSSSIYEKNNFEKLIIEQKNKIKNFKLNLKETKLISTEITLIKNEISREEKHHFTCDLKVYKIPSEEMNLIAANSK